MKKGTFVGMVILIITALIGIGILGTGLFISINKKRELVDENQKLKETINDLKKEISDADGLMNNLLDALDDENEEDEEDTITPSGELTEKDYVRSAFKKYLDESKGLKEYKIEKVEICDREEIEMNADQDVFEYEDSIAAIVTYSVKPETDKYTDWTAGNGEEDGEWIRNKSACVEVANTTKGYAVMNIGTGW